MRTPQRVTAFLAAMMITFGISDLNFEAPAFEYNQKAYVALIIGLVLLLAFIALKIRDKR